jgi:hypothetical protein
VCVCARAKQRETERERETRSMCSRKVDFVTFLLFSVSLNSDLSCLQVNVICGYGNACYIVVIFLSLEYVRKYFSVLICLQGELL